MQIRVAGCSCQQIEFKTPSRIESRSRMPYSSAVDPEGMEGGLARSVSGSAAELPIVQ